MAFPKDETKQGCCVKGFPRSAGIVFHPEGCIYLLEEERAQR